MIYLVTREQKLFESALYKILTVQESLDLMSSWKIVQFDCETMGLDCHIDRDLIYQFGNKEGTIQVVVDATTIDFSLYKEFIESRDLLIGHNIKFDTGYLFNYHIIPKLVYDTMVVEQLLYLGFPNFMIGASEQLIMKYSEWLDTRGYDYDWDNLDKGSRAKILQMELPDVSDFIINHAGVSLKALSYRYLNLNMSKEVRGQIIWRGIDDAVIDYAAKDVKYLYQIMQAQSAKFKQTNSSLAAKIECEYVPAHTYFEWCGVHMNETLWATKMKQDQEKRDTALKALNDFVINFGDPAFYVVDLQGDLFSGFNNQPKCTINWKSTKQVIPFLTKLGFNCRGLDKKTKEEKDSIDASVLEPQRHINPEFYDIYLAFTEAQKVCSTYGQNYLNAINPITGRMHTTFRQLGTDTGRLACGSQNQNDSLAKLKGLPVGQQKDPEKKCAYPQLQNLPADEITRASFCAEEGNAWISVDYCGEESVLMADMSKDEAMLNVFLKGEDMHSTVAYMIYPDKIPRETPIKDIKKLYKHLRQEAKGPEFCFAYAGNDSTLVAQYGMEPAVAKSIYTNYMSGFPGVADFQNRQKKFVVDNGYILISPVTGHKAYWWDWKYWKQRQASFNSDFWDEYKQYHKGSGDTIEKRVKKHFKAKTKWEKNACNSPLQGTGAIIFKIFAAKLFRWIVDNGYFGIVKFCVPVHDKKTCCG